MAKSYKEKLLDPRWQKKRLEVLNRDRFTCCKCGDTETTLHIHHKEYVKGREPWDYDDENFTTLCKFCHVIEDWQNGAPDGVCYRGFTPSTKEGDDLRLYLLGLTVNEKAYTMILRVDSPNKKVEELCVINNSDIKQSFEKLEKSLLFWSLM